MAPGLPRLWRILVPRRTRIRHHLSGTTSDRAPRAPTSRALPDEPFRLRIEAVGAESAGMPGVVGRAEQFTWGSGFVIALVQI
ncbi:hypothetical protein [Acidipropionibacterium jensenii]|uniref:hypothetical protein n=1 Tax=Acidipropionibacterium jensenii TaxID=1749 RepID=UPI000FD78196|nr:hypothetical protein [Acidipropionibacterium jensenii]